MSSQYSFLFLTKKNKKMIQRIQTVYLFIALILGASMLFTYQVSFTAETTSYILNYKGIISSGDLGGTIALSTVALTILLFLTPLVSLVTISLYKKRLIQIRLCAANIGLLIGATGLIYYFGSVGAKELMAVPNYQISMIFPLIGAILTFMALRAIGKDEALVRSMDRIR
jgi:hypothetical protein